MKKAFLFVALAAILSSATAQTYTYRQELNQEISHIVVKGNCVVRVQHDTCNWVAYRGSEHRDTARLVILEGNTLTTTPAANDKTLYVGTSIGKDSAEYILTFDIENDGIVYHKNKVFTKGHITHNAYNYKKDNSRSWTGIRKYSANERIYMDYFFGYNFWTTGNSQTESPIYPTTMFYMTNTGAKLGYSLYMDDHFAAGLGLQYGLYTARFKSPLVSYSRDANRLFTATSDSAGTWTTTAYQYTIGIPFHLTFYPIAKKHKFNLQLELTPMFSFGHILNQNYHLQSSDLTINNNYTRDLPYSLFSLSTRFSINYGILGIYTEYGITPVCRNIGFDNTTITPHNVCVGLRFNLLELGK
ncbi:MAG: hypothetical protein IJK84_04710 [Bacteroidales bacterium]|nr:hypothetical protein [Bacteroidales bacterium]